MTTKEAHKIEGGGYIQLFEMQKSIEPDGNMLPNYFEEIDEIGTYLSYELMSLTNCYRNYPTRTFSEFYNSNISHFWMISFITIFVLTDAIKIKLLPAYLVANFSSIPLSFCSLKRSNKWYLICFYLMLLYFLPLVHMWKDIDVWMLITPDFCKLIGNHSCTAITRMICIYIFRMNYSSF